MAVQTVDFANIDTVIKDGVILSDVVLDGAAIWAAPPAVGDGIAKEFSPVFTTSVDKSSALSGDGLIYATINDSQTILIYSRPSTNSTNFTLLDSNYITYNADNLELSHDGSVLLARTIGSNKLMVIADDGAGSYSIKANIPLSNSQYKDTSLGPDGATIAYITSSSLTVLLNIGSTGAQNWISVYSRPVNYRTRSVAVSRRNSNGVTVATGFEDPNTRYTDITYTYGTSTYQIGDRGQINRYIMDQNLQWTEAPVYVPPSHLHGVGSYLKISDDGKTIISSLPDNDADLSSYRKSSVSILTTNLLTNRLEIQYVNNSSDRHTHRQVAISGDGSTASVADIHAAPDRMRFIYSKTTPYDDESFVDYSFASDLDYAGILSYDGTTACLGKTVYEFPPILSISSSSSINGIALINEGQSITVTIDSRNVASGTLLDYTITGIQAADLVEPLTGSFTILDSVANLVFNTVNDLTTEGTQNAIIRLDDYPSVALNITILDSSQTP